MSSAEREQIAPEGRLLINLTKAEMLVGFGMVLIPGLGTLGAVTFIAGGMQYLIIQYAKRQGAKEGKIK